ncbi:MAG: glutaredoxin 3 [Woeseiaceae bacterium]|jgi:glutaredoxin 3|nr:glutaredoxin 3 [Woeseiaceae bacterium]
MSDKNKVTMYSTRTCGYCGAARMLLTRKAVEFEDFVVTDDVQKRQEMQERSGSRSVPQIFIGDKSIGGYEELRALDVSGELDKLLAG